MYSLLAVVSDTPHKNSRRCSDCYLATFSAITGMFKHFVSDTGGGEINVNLSLFIKASIQTLRLLYNEQVTAQMNL